MPSPPLPRRTAAQPHRRPRLGLLHHRRCCPRPQSSCSILRHRRSYCRCFAPRRHKKKKRGWLLERKARAERVRSKED
jgi:hypothetical protein